MDSDRLVLHQAFETSDVHFWLHDRVFREWIGCQNSTYVLQRCDIPFDLVLQTILGTRLASD